MLKRTLHRNEKIFVVKSKKTNQLKSLKTMDTIYIRTKIFKNKKKDIIEND